ncbi:MAG: acetyl-CoA carboxylase biotin carboxylase subunit family protein [Thermoanaerobaculia bacterium]
MHIALLGPDLFPAFHDFARALKEVGARVTGVGSTPAARLRAGLKRHLDDWCQVRSPFDGAEIARVLAGATARRPVDRLETVEERLIEAAADARRHLGLPGLSVDSARLCRDKPAMKEALRRAGIPCAESAAVDSLAGLQTFAEKHGFPLVLKPRAGLGSLETFRVGDGRELERAAGRLGVTKGDSAAVEEFVDGHEGFYDTISIAGEPAIEFASHYYPSVLEALSDRTISPQIAASNRIDLPSYSELREVGRKAIQVLEIGTSATHMEWFFGPKGLKVSEIGARAPGERIWDLYCVGNDLDLYRSWAEALVLGEVREKPSRRLATGSVQVRPDREGKIVRYEGLDEVLRRCGDAIFAHETPPIGRKTVPIAKGYLANAWFRLRHPDYDTLREMMSWIGSTLRVHAA